MSSAKILLGASLRGMAPARSTTTASGIVFSSAFITWSICSALLAGIVSLRPQLLLD